MCVVVVIVAVSVMDVVFVVVDPVCVVVVIVADVSVLVVKTGRSWPPLSMFPSVAFSSSA